MVESYLKAHQRINGMLTLPNIDIELKHRHHGRENAHHVFDSFTLSEDFKKQIE